MLIIKIPERRQRHWRRSGIFIINFDYITYLGLKSTSSYLFLVLLLLTLNK